MQMNIFSQQVCQGIRKGKNRDRLDQMKEFGLMKMQVTNSLHSNLKYIFVFLHYRNTLNQSNIMVKYIHGICQVVDLVGMLKSTDEDTLDLFRWFELLLQK